MGWWNVWGGLGVGGVVVKVFGWYVVGWMSIVGGLDVFVDGDEVVVFWIDVIGVWVDDFVVDVLFDDVCVLVGGVGDYEQWSEYCGWYVYYVVVDGVELVQVWEYFFDVLYY